MQLLPGVCSQNVFKTPTISTDTCPETLSPLVNCKIDNVLSEIGPKMYAACTNVRHYLLERKSVTEYRFCWKFSILCSSERILQIHQEL